MGHKPTLRSGAHPSVREAADLRFSGCVACPRGPVRWPLPLVRLAMGLARNGKRIFCCKVWRRGQNLSLRPSAPD